MKSSTNKRQTHLAPLKMPNLFSQIQRLLSELQIWLSNSSQITSFSALYYQHRQPLPPFSPFPSPLQSILKSWGKPTQVLHIPGSLTYSISAASLRSIGWFERRNSSILSVRTQALGLMQEGWCVMWWMCGQLRWRVILQDMAVFGGGDFKVRFLGVL